MCNAGTRAKRTATKTAVGGLPAPFYGVPILGIGDGTPCWGCGETIAPHEKSYTVDLLGALTLSFHTECAVEVENRDHLKSELDLPT